LRKNIGCDIHNADRIIPEFQKLEVGDNIRLHPKTPPLPVVAVDPGRFLLIGVVPDYNNPEGKYGGMLWLFFLDEINEKTTRLISHGRTDYSSELANKLQFGPTLMEPITFVMGRKMLLGIKQRAEAAAER